MLLPPIAQKFMLLVETLITFPLRLALVLEVGRVTQKLGNIIGQFPARVRSMSPDSSWHYATARGKNPSHE